LIDALKNHIGVLENENEELLKKLEALQATVRQILNVWKFNVDINEIKEKVDKIIADSWANVVNVKNSL